MNPMHCSCCNVQHHLHCYWDHNFHEIVASAVTVHIHCRERFKGTVACEVFGEFACRQKTYSCFTVLSCNIATCFRGGTEKWGWFHSSHLQRQRDNKDDWHAWWLWEHMVKFNCSPSWQSIFQNPSFTSHFSMNTLSCSSALESACIVWLKECSSRSIALLGAVFVVVSLIQGHREPSDRHSMNDKSKIEWNAFALCGMAAKGEIFSYGGGLSLISSQLIWIACPAFTFSMLSSQKCSIASGNNAEQWGPLATTSHISAFVHGVPVRVVQPSVVYLFSIKAAGWCEVSPFGHISFQ